MKKESEKTVTYGTVEQIYRLGNDRHSVYGIAAFYDGDVCAVCDAACGISEAEESVEELARLCNELSLSPVHLHDVADDFIFSEKMQK